MWNNNQGFNQGFSNQNQGFPQQNQDFNQFQQQQQQFIQQQQQLHQQMFQNQLSQMQQFHQQVFQQAFTQPSFNVTVATNQQSKNTFEPSNTYIHHPLHKVVGDTLLTGQPLRAGECIKSKTYSYFLIMQKDGNLVLYNSDHFVSPNAIWSSGTNGKGHGPHHLRMQEDGNLVVYDSHNKPTWSSDTYQKGPYGHTLIMQDDGNLVIYDGDKKPAWASNTQRN